MSGTGSGSGTRSQRGRERSAEGVKRTGGVPSVSEEGIRRSSEGDKASIEIYDTTLRDGSQLEGISLTVEDKLRIAEQLDWLRGPYTAAGGPGGDSQGH